MQRTTHTSKARAFHNIRFSRSDEAFRLGFVLFRAALGGWSALRMSRRHGVFYGVHGPALVTFHELAVAAGRGPLLFLSWGRRMARLHVLDCARRCYALPSAAVG